MFCLDVSEWLLLNVGKKAFHADQFFFNDTVVDNGDIELNLFTSYFTIMICVTVEHLIQTFKSDEPKK